MRELKLIFGGGEIKRLDTQIKDALKLLNGANLESVKKDSSLRDAICDLGFEASSSSGIAFIGKRQVIKCGLITRRPPPIHHRVPTLIYAYEYIRPSEWEWHYVVLIQPKVVIPNEDIIEEAMPKFRHLAHCDSHSENIGSYRGKIVLFDW